MIDTHESSRPPPPWLLALGRATPHRCVLVSGRSYEHRRTFKHDFFAFTALYEGATGLVVVKIGRTAPFWGLPASWVGDLLTRHESRMYRLAEGIAGVPRLVGQVGATGLAHDYIAGRPLQKGDRPDDEFFPSLGRMLAAMHELGMAYVDLEKPENVLLGEDGRPWLFDFQISWHVPENRGGRTWLARKVLDVLSASDRYHLLKHWRRFRPDQVERLGLSAVGAVPPWIRLHRAIFRPITLARRQVLVWLGVRSSIRARSPG